MDWVVLCELVTQHWSKGPEGENSRKGFYPPCAMRYGRLEAFWCLVFIHNGSRFSLLGPLRGSYWARDWSLPVGQREPFESRSQSYLMLWLRIERVQLRLSQLWIRWEFFRFWHLSSTVPLLCLFLLQLLHQLYLAHQSQRWRRQSVFGLGPGVRIRTRSELSSSEIESFCSPGGGD